MSTSVQMSAAFPVSAVDPFADDFLAEPYPFYGGGRGGGPVVGPGRLGVVDGPAPRGGRGGAGGGGAFRPRARRRHRRLPPPKPGAPADPHPRTRPAAAHAQPHRDE